MAAAEARLGLAASALLAVCCSARAPAPEVVSQRARALDPAPMIVETKGVRKLPVATRREELRETLFGRSVEDPYRWLEDGKSDEVQAWIGAQNALLERTLSAVPERASIARRLGVDEAKIEAVPYWTVAEVFTPVERAVLAFADGMALEQGRVHDRVFDALRRHLSDEHILMLAYFVGMYGLHATTTKALRLEFDDIPERVVEIPAPSTPGVQDWLRPAK